MSEDGDEMRTNSSGVMSPPLPPETGAAAASVCLRPWWVLRVRVGGLAGPAGSRDRQQRGVRDLHPRPQTVPSHSFASSGAPVQRVGAFEHRRSRRKT